MQAVSALVPSPTVRFVRDAHWLRDLHEEIWDRYFSDTPRVNYLRVSFGPTWKTRLGMITMSLDEGTTFLVVNGLLQLPEIPEYVVTVTVAHELVHYAHGFGSPLPQRYKHPHRGGIVKRELVRRGLATDYARYDDWIYDYWYEGYEQHLRRFTQEVLPINA